MPLPIYRSPRPRASRAARPTVPFPTPPWALLPLSGVALGASFPPSPLAPLAWVALVPVLLRWATVATAGRMLAEAYASLGLAGAIAFHWVLLHEMPRAALASLGGLMLYPFLLALPFAASVPFRNRWGLGPGFGVLAAVSLAIEWGISHGPLAFPWMLIGHTQATLDPFRQLADLTGPSLLSGWVWALNGCVLGTLLAGSWLRRGAAVVMAALLVGGAAQYGLQRMSTPTPVDDRTDALLVQPAIPPLQWANTADRTRVDALLRQTEAALDTVSAPVALVVWPETALPALPNAAAQRALYDQLQQWTASHDVALLSGAVEPDTVLSHGARTYHNAALLIRADTVQRYRKNYLVPFAEHVPFSEYLPALQALGVPAGGVAGYTRSRLQPTLTAPDFQLGALICFESTFAHHLRSYVDPQSTTRPVDFLVTVAQVGWWGPSPGYQQHLAFSQLRAIAVRRAMAFVAETGRTALIDPRGGLSATAEWMDPTVRRASIPHATPLSPYVRFGDWLSMLALLMTSAVSAVGIYWYVRGINF